MSYVFPNGRSEPTLAKAGEYIVCGGGHKVMRLVKDLPYRGALVTGTVVVVQPEYHLRENRFIPPCAECGRLVYFDDGKDGCLRFSDGWRPSLPIAGYIEDIESLGTGEAPHEDLSPRSYMELPDGTRVSPGMPRYYPPDWDEPGDWSAAVVYGAHRWPSRSVLMVPGTYGENSE